MLEGVINAKEDPVRIKSGHFVLLSGDSCLVTAGRIKLYCMVISSELKGERTMNIQRLVSIGCVGFFMFLAVINGLAVSNSPMADSNHPLPVRAPLATQGPLPTQAPIAPGGTAPQLLPQPQPVPVPPTAAATAIAPTQVDSLSVSLIPLLLVVTATGALIGLMVLGQGRQRANGRFLHPSTLAQGAQS
jgi:hypothetical protein